jgi:hypothetical protein
MTNWIVQKRKNPGWRRLPEVYMDLMVYRDNLVDNNTYCAFNLDMRGFVGLGFTEAEHLWYVEFGSMDGFSV